MASISHNPFLHLLSGARSWSRWKRCSPGATFTAQSSAKFSSSLFRLILTMGDRFGFASYSINFSSQVSGYCTLIGLFCVDRSEDDGHIYSGFWLAVLLLHTVFGTGPGFSLKVVGFYAERNLRNDGIGPLCTVIWTYSELVSLF